MTVVRPRVPWTCIAALGLVGACSTATLHTPGEVRRESDGLIRYRGPEVEVVLSTRYPDTHLGDEWLILPASVTATAADRVRIDRESIELRGPTGIIHPPISQERFAEVYSSLYGALRAARIASPPVDHTGAARRPCGRWFYAAPGHGYGSPSLEVSRFSRCGGPLVFHIPGGVQAGSWVLTIDLAEREVRIPFTLGGSSLPRR